MEIYSSENVNLKVTYKTGNDLALWIKCKQKTLISILFKNFGIHRDLFKGIFVNQS